MELCSFATFLIVGFNYFRIEQSLEQSLVIPAVAEFFSCLFLFIYVMDIYDNYIKTLF